MPNLNTSLHLEMYERGKQRLSPRGRLKRSMDVVFAKDDKYGLEWIDQRAGHRLLGRIKRAVTILHGRGDIYGLEWGDPEANSQLKHVRNHFLLPYIDNDTTVLEIGPGGGRWTRYMTKAKTIYAVDYHQELLDELLQNFGAANIVPIKNNGDDLPHVPDDSIDFVFSFGTFVHLNMPIIEAYLKELPRVLKPTASVFIQYSDKTKPLGQSNKGFSENNPEKMRALVQGLGYTIEEEDVDTLPHSAMIRLSRR